METAGKYKGYVSVDDGVVFMMENNNFVPKIAVLMSTYNGERFLCEQIDSIMRQRNVLVDLYVRDDGSSDGTRNILCSYLHFSNIHILEGENVGVGNSFMKLFYDQQICAEYYAFADQDDIWLEDKLFHAVEEIRKRETRGRPFLYAGNQMLIDEHGEELGIRYHTPRNADYHYIINGNPLSGCTMVWNQALCRKIREAGKRPGEAFFKKQLHDVWVALIASLSGDIYFDMEPYILYRQHSANVVGAYADRRIEVIKQQIEKLFRKNLRCIRSERAREICVRYPELIIRDKNDLQVYAYYKSNRKLKKNLMMDKKIISATNEKVFLFKLKVILGFF